MTVTGVVLPDRRYTLEEAVAEHGDGTGLGLLLLTGTLCNDAVIDENTPNGILGDPTEGALVIAAQQAGLVQRDLKALMPRVRELPFDSDRKRMSTVHVLPSSSQGASLHPILAAARQQGHTGHLMLAKGAADGLIEVCRHILINGAIQLLTEKKKDEILAENTAMAKNGMRVLGLAYRFIDVDELDRFWVCRFRCCRFKFCGSIW